MPNELEEANSLIYRAFQLACVVEDKARDYDATELEESIYCVVMAGVKLRALPGGKEAAERVYARAKAELASRGKESQ